MCLVEGCVCGVCVCVVCVCVCGGRVGDAAFCNKGSEKQREERNSNDRIQLFLLFFSCSSQKYAPTISYPPSFFSHETHFNFQRLPLPIDEE